MDAIDIKTMRAPHPPFACAKDGYGARVAGLVGHLRVRRVSLLDARSNKILGIYIRLIK